MVDPLTLIYPAAQRLPYEELRIGIALLGTAAATYFDLSNNRNVPNSLLYGFLAFAVLLNLFAPGESIIYTFAVSAIIFAAGWLFYRAGQIGGADVFVLASISLLLPVQPLSSMQNATTPLLQFPFALYIFAIAGLLFILAMLATYAPAALRGALSGKIKIAPEKWAYAAGLALLFAAFAYFAQSVPFVPASYIALLGILVLSSMFFLLFREHVRDAMLSYVPLSKIEEEDVIALEHMGRGLAEKYSIPRVMGAPDLARLKKSKIPLARWPVYKKMHVFLPYILLALLVMILLGDPFTFLSGL